MGVPVRERHTRQIRERFQADLAAAEFSGTMGVMVESCREEGAQAVRRETFVFKGCQTVFVEMEFL